MARGLWGKRSVKRSLLLVDAGQLFLPLTFLMRPAANMHIHGFRTGEFCTAHRTRQHFEILPLLRISLAILRLPLAVLRLPLVFQARSPLFFCKMPAQLLFSLLLLSSFFLTLSMKVLRMSGLELSLS